jgi:hypothetical protein
MSDDENVIEDLEVDPVYGLIVENRFDLLNFCIEQLETESMEHVTDSCDIDEEELEVSQN